MAFGDEKTVVQLVKEPPQSWVLGSENSRSRSTSGLGGRTHNSPLPGLLRGRLSCGLTCFHVLPCECCSCVCLLSRLCALHWSPLPLGCSWELLPTCPNVSLSPSHCALFLSWSRDEGGRRGAQFDRLSQLYLCIPNPSAEPPNPGLKPLT